MKHLSTVFYELSNFLIGGGVASCCAEPQHFQGEKHFLIKETEREEMWWTVNMETRAPLNRIIWWLKPFYFPEYFSIDFLFVFYFLFCFIIAMFSWKWPSKSSPYDWVSYSTPAGICTVHGNNYKCGRYIHWIMRCMHVHRENAQRHLHVCPFNT